MSSFHGLIFTHGFEEKLMKSRKCTLIAVYSPGCQLETALEILSVRPRTKTRRSDVKTEEKPPLPAVRPGTRRCAMATRAAAQSEQEKVRT